jgi:hypothetical protein
MKTYLLAATLIGACSVSETPPTPTEQFSMMGQYDSQQEAVTAMREMPDCKG